MPIQTDIGDGLHHLCHPRQHAGKAARAGVLVTFGRAATFAETGYGYIEAPAEVGGALKSIAYFAEKTDLQRAEQMVAAGDHLWNAGMLMLGAVVFLRDCEILVPKVFAGVSGSVTHARLAHTVIKTTVKMPASPPLNPAGVAMAIKLDRHEQELRSPARSLKST